MDRTLTLASPGARISQPRNATATTAINEQHEAGCAAEDDALPQGCAESDVFFVEGNQECYGNKDAWSVARRY
jgi:hypothetical protein